MALPTGIPHSRRKPGSIHPATEPLRSGSRLSPGMRVFFIFRGKNVRRMTQGSLLPGEDPGGDIGWADGPLKGKIATGFRRLWAKEAAGYRAGDARLGESERILAAGQRRTAGDRERRVPVKIADRHRADLRAEIVDAVEAADRDVVGA